MTARGRYADGVVWPDPRPAAPRVLVCFSFCGGGTAPYRPWQHSVPDDVDLALVCLPGRERRVAEPPALTWDDLRTEVLTSVRSVAGRPYVLFGHSMGAWVAFDTTVHMQQSGRPPQALVVSASDVPGRPVRGAPTSRTPDEDLLAWLRTVGQLPDAIVEDPVLRQMALDLFRADTRAAESYAYPSGTVVDCPLRLLQPDADPDVDPDDDSWSRLTVGPYHMHRLPGGHFYSESVWAELPRHMGL